MISFKKKIFDFIVSVIDYKNKRKILSFLKKNIGNKKIIIFDVGAHLGETAMFFYDNFNIKSIYSFEPNKNIFFKLKERLKNYKKLHAYNIAIGEKNKIKKFHIYEDTQSSSFNNLNKKSSYFLKKNFLSFHQYNSKNIKVKVETLKNFIFSKKIKKIDIMKIDTEGYEYNVLKGLSKNNFKNISYIYFEHHYNNMLLKKYTFMDINKILTDNNFICVNKIKMSFRKSFEYIYVNKNIL